jgi:acyl-CoA reductase-like NAD-dependent aldehyde dehydrogenase
MAAAQEVTGASIGRNVVALGVRPPTEESDLDRRVSHLRDHAREFARLPIEKKIDLLEDIRRRVRDVAPEWVLAACAAKGIPVDAPVAGEEWISGPSVLVRNIRLTIRALNEIRTRGVPVLSPSWLRDLPSGAVAARVTPYDGYDSVMFAGFTAETWLRPGIRRSEVSDHQASFYKTRDAEGGVALVLGAGNIACLGSIDAFQRMFTEGNVCILKLNPVNDYLGPFLERAFAPLVEAGYLALVYGGRDVGAYLAYHPGVDRVHVTGSDKTHDEIVWGPTGAAREERKRRGDPILKKPITSELGNISPVLVVPGPYTDAELSNMAENVAGMVAHNASFNCNAAKLLVLPKGWASRDLFIEKLSGVLARVPLRKAYYPGAFTRYEALTAGRPDLRKIGPARDLSLPWTLILRLDPDDASERCFSTEPFCSILSEVSVGSADPAEFLAAAVPFVNDRVWGTLVASLFVHPTVHTAPSTHDAVEDAIRDLRYGTVAVNVWPALGYALCTTPWGGHTGATLDNVQSGMGWVNNTVMLEDIEKCVVRGPLQAKPKPIYFPTHKTLHTLGRKVVDFETAPSWLKVPSLAVTAFSG